MACTVGTLPTLTNPTGQITMDTVGTQDMTIMTVHMIRIAHMIHTAHMIRTAHTIHMAQTINGGE